MSESLAYLLVYAVAWFGGLLILWLVIASAVRSGVLSALRKDRWDVWRDQQKANGQTRNVKPSLPAPPPVKPRAWPEPGDVFSVVDDTREDET